MDEVARIRNHIGKSCRERLLEDRIVLLDGPITEEAVNEIVCRMLYLQSEDRNAGIHFLVDSPGGWVVSGLALVDTIEIVNLTTPVLTCCYGHAGGMAALAVAHGTKSHRAVVRGATLSLFLPDELELPTSDEQAWLRTVQTIADSVARDTGNSAQQVHRDLQAGHTFDADTAQAYGLVDAVVDDLPVELPWAAE